MRVSDLSRSTGVPVPTIKYYLREGLLHRGETTSPNQASYDAGHVRRLRLIRAMVEVGGLPVSTVRDVLAAVDDPGLGLHDMLGRAVGPLTEQPPDETDTELDRARAEIDTLITRNGWTVGTDAPTRRAAAGVLARMRRLGQERFAANLDEYAAGAARLAETDLAPLATIGSREEVAEAALVGIVLGDALVSALRRMAQENLSAKYFPPTTAPTSGEQP